MRLKNHRVIDAADIEKIAQLVNDAADRYAQSFPRLAPGGCGRGRARRSLCKIWLTGKFGELPAGWKSNRHFKSRTMPLPPHLYRIAREAVINANKHAQAREIVVKLERSRQGNGFARDR